MTAPDRPRAAPTATARIVRGSRSSKMIAQRYGLKKWGNVPLERLLDDPPEVLLAGQAAPNAPTFAEKILNHPALASISPRMTRAVFPERLLYCGGPGLIDTAAALAAARRQVLGAAA
jgi:iron complex transport system substrate-binding protein